MENNWAEVMVLEGDGVRVKISQYGNTDKINFKVLAVLNDGREGGWVLGEKIETAIKILTQAKDEISTLRAYIESLSGPAPAPKHRRTRSREEELS